MLLLLKHRLSLLCQFSHSVKQCQMSRRPSSVDTNGLRASPSNHRDRLLTIVIPLLLLLLLLLLSRSLLLCHDISLRCVNSLVIGSKVWRF
jgi:hypothetical protein